MQHKRDQDDIMINYMYMDDFPEIGVVLNSTLDKIIIFATNDCGYSGSTNNIMVNWVHPFLKAKTVAIKTDNTN